MAESETTSLKKVTLAEVAEHNNNRSTWIIIGNKVYDVTAFLDDHPGGCEVLLEQAGRDGTEAYEDVGHSTDARDMKENYLVAEIVDEQKKTYSYDKEHWSKVTNDVKEKSDAGKIDSMVAVALLASLVAIIYYFLSF